MARFLAAVRTQFERNRRVLLNSAFHIVMEDYPDCREQMNHYTPIYRKDLKPVYAKGTLVDSKDLARQKVLTPYEEGGMILVNGNIGEFTEWILL